ncbi:right-handed parallel beta-helix repeat-containing protein [Mobilitalea sibirica]|uniref:Right-handed parallel beta-helix repeat-containing protein n=1 Tax=Mobilitalea sibirica TaxID=1462919 RepID=A0A8J7HBX5_9FIRM|nr:right-handed parallel beta-helix repeat-containing protein [Mobilitalea sibirica]MBH1940447.1 right-handed parallel beta-helix repeat-containing protein [Mobilitalea sibirica]
MNRHKITCRKRNNWLLCFLLLTIVLFIPLSPAPKAEAGSKTYTLKATGQPYKKTYTNYSTYNEYTRQYYMLRSYLEQLERVGGGTLILDQGTYTITNTLYIPSNVTIVLKDGVKIIKGSKTGIAKLPPSKSLFQLVAPSKAKKSGAASKYDGEKNILIRGEGTAVIDLNYVKDTVGIVMGNNKNITIEGVTFQEMYGGNFIKIGASIDVTIQNNVFRYHKNSAVKSKEAIVIETPDTKTGSFSYSWSKKDKTISKDIFIEKNTFYQLERAIGSSKYSEDKYHKKIIITGNSIAETDSHAIRIMNWEECEIKNNTFTDIKNKTGSLKAVLLSGVKNPTITQNEFINCDRAIQIMPWKNNNKGSSYAVTYNQISEEDKAAMLLNTLTDMGEYLIRYNKTYNEFSKNTEKWAIIDNAVKDFVIEPSSEPFQNYFTNYSTYNKNTKQYYVIRSYLEQLERIGGGTLTLNAGTYLICNVLYVPSDVTINFEDGVIIKKTEETGIDELESSLSIFQLAAPSKSKTEGAYGGYEGESNIHFIGKGTVIIDLNFIRDAIGIVLGHNQNVSITGITFQNMQSGHFIEVDASSNVTIEDNRFKYHKPSGTGIKEAINIDTPDKNTAGFNAVWSNYDRTPNKDIVIKDNYFEDLERAIGTHKYSEGKYHENVQILHNVITNTVSDAIRIINWDRPVIKENEITMVANGVGNDRAILASGLKDPVITENLFSDVARPIQIMPWKNNEEGSQYAVTYNEISSDNIRLMQKNYVQRVTEPFIRMNKSYNVFDYNTDRYYIDSTYIRWN